jgi:hypothetical protein
MNHALQNEVNEDLWHVEVAPNDIRVVTLEQLDEAFQQGLVNAKTRVFQDGMDEPALLGELLGLDEEDGDEPEEVQAAPPPSSVVSRHHQNTLVGLAAEPPPVRSAPPPQRMSAPPPQAIPQQRMSAPPQGPYGVPVQAAPAQRPTSAPPPLSQAAYAQVQSGQRAPQSRRPAPATTEGTWPPVVTRSSAPPSTLAPNVMNVAPSVVPMALDLSDVDLDYPKPKRTGKVLLFGSGMLAIAAGVALAVTGTGASMLNSLGAAAPPPPAAIVKKAPEPQKSHALDVGDAPVKLKETPAAVVITTRENEAQQLAAAGVAAPVTAEVTSAANTKAAATLAPAGKKGAPTRAMATKHARGAKSGGGAPKSGSGHALKGGGGTYDPLNGAL